MRVTLDGLNVIKGIMSAFVKRSHQMPDYGATRSTSREKGERNMNQGNKNDSTAIDLA